MVGKRGLGVFGILAAIASVVPVAGSALAQVVGAPRDWQMGFPPAYTPLMERVESLHNLLLVIITLISVFVLALLAYICVRFRKDANPTPSKTTHNTTLEVLWTVIPVIILVVVAVPSFKLLYYGDRTPNPEMTLKVVGHQ